MSGPADRRGGWRIDFGSGTRRPGTPGGPRGPRGPLRPTGGGGDGDGDEPGGPIRPPLSPEARRYAFIALGIAIILVAIFLRPLLHAPLMWVWRAPLPWIAAIVVLLVGRVLGNRQKLTVADLQAGRYPGRGLWASSFAVAGLVFFVLQAINPLLVQRSLSTHTTFTPLEQPPDAGIVRLVPREVAQQVLTGSLNSSTEGLSDLRVVDTPKGLQWSAIRTPEGLFRRYTKKSAGLVLLDAQNTTRSSQDVDAEFKYAPGLAVFDSLTWQLRERKLLVDLTDPVGILDKQNRPLILVPYLKYKGFPIRRPVLGGAFLAHPDGKIEDLSVAEAQKRPEIADSGRLYPDVLTRREHDSYALKGGIWNYLFVHENQTKITDTELNRQPYLLQGPNGGNTWASVAQPYGRAQATSAIFFTDATTGKTQIWKVPEKTKLTGNARALAATRSLNIAGVSFTNSDLRATGSGGFRAVEPRPVFIKGKLYFLVSIIPDGANNVSKTVFISAETNRSAGIFEGDTAGLQQTLDFLKNGPADTGTVTNGEDTPTDDDGSGTPTGTTPSGTSSGSGKKPTEAELRQRVAEAIDRQARALEDLRALQRDLAGTTP
jgi:hypothetical protein